MKKILIVLAFVTLLGLTFYSGYYVGVLNTNSRILLELLKTKSFSVNSKDIWKEINISTRKELDEKYGIGNITQTMGERNR